MCAVVPALFATVFLRSYTRTTIGPFYTVWSRVPIFAGAVGVSVFAGFEIRAVGMILFRHFVLN